MQAAGMLRGIRAVYLLVFLIFLIGYAHSFPLQLLPSIPGYIPVYIRHGDQPLEEINPALAEAFNEKPSVTKSVKLENIPNLADIDLGEEESDLYIGKSKKKNIYPVHIRQTDSSNPTPDKDKDDNKATGKSSDVEVPKLLSIYELHDNGESVDGSGRQKNPKRKPVQKEPVVKVSPLSEKEKEELEKLTIQVEKDGGTPNDLSDVYPSYSELSTKLMPQHQDNVRNYVPVLKVEHIIVDESTDQPNTHLIKDLLQLSTEQDTSVASVTEEEVPIKVQRPAGILSNVQKLSPIPMTEGNKDPSSKEEIYASRQDDAAKDLTERNDDITAS